MTPTAAHANTQRIIRSEAGALYKCTILAVTPAGAWCEIYATKLGGLDWLTHKREIRYFGRAEIVEESE